MPGILRTVDNYVGRLLRSQHPALRRVDRFMAKTFGQLPSLRQLIPADGPLESPNFFMTGDDNRRRIEAVFDAEMGFDVKVEVGRSVQGTKGLYQVRQMFAEGGMARIFVVHDQQGREYLLKKLMNLDNFSKADRDQLRLRFAKEIQIMENINSRNVVALIDRDPQPFPSFYIMERIQGKDLISALKPGQTFDPRVSLGLMIQILKGLVAFERAARQISPTGNFAHRDIKPENIFLEIADNKVKRAVLGDFGIAKLPQSELTAVEQFMGTPGYAAPEVIHYGGTKQADHRADIFSLGAVLYWLLTGVEPFVSNDPSQMISFSADPKHFIDKLIPNRPAHVSPLIWQATFRALAPKPEDRFSSYQAMHDVLLTIFQMS
ncbi:MAG: serine/threonine-protein kinase [Candidatus Margulisiibacteriota bacterium]